RLLEHDADPLAERALHARGVVAEHGHLAAVAGAVALEDLDGGRLACAVRAEQAEAPPRLDLEVDAAHGLDVSVALQEPADRDGGHGRSIWTTPAVGNGGSVPPVSAAA